VGGAAVSAASGGAGGAGTVTIVADGPGEVQGYATAIGGAGPAVGGAANANATVDAGTEALSTAAADAGGSNSKAGKAIATAGGEGGTRLDIEASANSISTNSSLAVYGITGESSLDWFGSNSGMVWTQTQYGTALPAFLPDGNAEAAGSASPTAAVYNPILTAEPTVKSGLSGGKILSIGELEAVNDSDASSASQTATAEITTDVNLSTLNENGALAIGLYDGAEIGSGAETVSLTVSDSLQTAALYSISGVSASTAVADFNDAIPLLMNPSFGTSGTMTVEASLSVTSSAADAGFSGHFILAAKP
jgi:hypothetical protein